MVHLQSKTHLILWLEKNCPRKAIVRALLEGTVELYGGFNPIPPTTRPGWILRIESATGKVWYVAVIAYQNRYGIRILKEVPWKNWMGMMFDNHLYSGDNPSVYQKLKQIKE